MSSFKYKNMQRFVRNVIHPFIINLRDMLNAYYKKLCDMLAALEAKVDREIARVDKRIDDLTQYVKDEIIRVEGLITKLRSDMNAADTALGKRIDALDTKVDNNYNDLLSRINNVITAYKAADANLQTQIDSLSGRVTNLQNKINQVEASIPVIPPIPPDVSGDLRAHINNRNNPHGVHWGQANITVNNATSGGTIQIYTI